MPDITELPGNPAFALRQHYQELMAIADPIELYNRTLALIQPFAGRGMSQTNFAKFRQTMAKLRSNLVGLQKYITNFLLKAGGDGVIEGMAWGEIVSDHVGAIASVVSEDINYNIIIQPWQRHIIDVARENGIHIRLISWANVDA